MNVSKEEMNSTGKMIEVLGKRLYQVWGALKYKEKILLVKFLHTKS
jgi:hypothetical protein